jgi:predicted peptidase
MAKIIRFSIAAFVLVMISAGGAAEKAAVSQRDKAAVKLADALCGVASVYEKAGDLAAACAIYSEAVFHMPDHPKAGKTREKLAREIEKGAAEKKDIDAEALKKAEAALKKVALKDLPAVVSEYVKTGDYKAATYWTRKIAKTVDLAKPPADLAKDAEKTRKTLKDEARRMSKAKAHRQALAAAMALLPKEGKDADLDGIISAAQAALAEENKAIETDISQAKSKYVKRSLTGHEMKYFLSLPSAFDPAKKYPVVVVVVGSGADYENQITDSARFKTKDIIYVVPVTASNTNQRIYPNLKTNDVAFDDEGIRLMLSDLEAMFSADRERFFISGFSGGGTICYYEAANRTQVWRAAAPRHPNYYPQKWPVESANAFKGDVYFPIHIFTSADDEYKLTINGTAPGVEPQTKQAISEFTAKHFVCLRRTELSGYKHNESNQYFEKVLSWFDEAAAGVNVSGDPPDYFKK